MLPKSMLALHDSIQGVQGVLKTPLFLLHCMDSRTFALLQYLVARSKPEDPEMTLNEPERRFGLSPIGRFTKFEI